MSSTHLVRSERGNIHDSDVGRLRRDIRMNENVEMARDPHRREDDALLIYFLRGEEFPGDIARICRDGLRPHL